ncbi:MAG: hypothetical protein KHW87_00275 [Clostridiales bacterium]|nr:hypothetical protein [Clostridiales bacterium]
MQRRIPKLQRNIIFSVVCTIATGRERLTKHVVCDMMILYRHSTLCRFLRTFMLRPWADFITDRNDKETT